MKTPESLRGKKAEKFEELFTAFMKKVEAESEKWGNKLSGLEFVWYQLGEFTDVADLYQTPFTPELIELFEVKDMRLYYPTDCFANYSNKFTDLSIGNDDFGNWQIAIENNEIKKKEN